MVLFFGCCLFSSSAHLVRKQALRGTVSGCFEGGLGSVLGVLVLGVPQNWVLHVVYQLFRRNFFGTLTAVLLHRRKRILITTFFLSFLSISELYDLGLLRGQRSRSRVKIYEPKKADTSRASLSIVFA